MQYADARWRVTMLKVDSGQGRPKSLSEVRSTIDTINGTGVFTAARF